jgi:putative sigma-54 modulation protein
MRIEIKGRNLPISDELRAYVERRFEKVAKQVSDLAVLTVELCEDRDASPTTSVAEATLRLKGVTLRAQDASRDVKHAVNLVADDMSRQVKRHRDKRRNRREARAASAAASAQPAAPASAQPAAPVDEIAGQPQSAGAM